MKIFTAFFLILMSLVASGQVQKRKNPSRNISNSIRNLKVGEYVPEIIIKKIINDKEPSINTSDFKDKLLILDFWATTCSSCVIALPRLMALQDKFGDQVKILPVTYESEDRTRSFLQKNRHLKSLVIPTVVDDKVLSKWFRHTLISHEVWIYKGKIIAITGSEYVDEETLKLILSGGSIDLPIKDDFKPPLPSINFQQPLLKVNEKNDMAKNRLIKYASIFRYIEGSETFKEGVSYDSVQNIRRNYIINCPVLFAYQNNLIKIRNLEGLPINFLLQPNRVILEVKNSENYYNTNIKYAERWTKEHFYCFEFVSPNDGATELDQRKMIIENLDHLLNLHGRVERRKVRCIILIKRNETGLLKSVGGKTELIDDEPTKKIRNMQLKKMVDILNSDRKMPLLFDETNYSEAVDLDINIESWDNIPDLKMNLQKYGLDIKEEEREMDMLVLTELNYSLNH